MKAKPKPKMNTHPTHTQCVGRMGGMAINSPHRCRCFFCLFSLFPPHLGKWVGFLGAFVCFSCVFWVCVECVFSPLSNIVYFIENLMDKPSIKKLWYIPT